MTRADINHSIRYCRRRLHNESGNVTPELWPRSRRSARVKNRYLSLKFTIKGRVHFSWVRLKVSIAGNRITATLTGYAYKPIPNKPIIPGKTKGADVV